MIFNQKDSISYFSSKSLLKMESIKKFCLFYTKNRTKTRKNAGFFHKSMSKRLFCMIFNQKDGIYYFSFLEFIENGKYKIILFILNKKSDENKEKCGIFSQIYDQKAILHDFQTKR